MRKLLKPSLKLLAIVGCYVGLPGAAFLICYLCGLTKPGEMSGHWTDNAGMPHEPQADPTGIILTFVLMLVALIIALCINIPIINKIDKIKDRGLNLVTNLSAVIRWNCNGGAVGWFDRFIATASLSDGREIVGRTSQFIKHAVLNVLRDIKAEGIPLDAITIEDMGDDDTAEKFIKHYWPQYLDEWK